MSSSTGNRQGRAHSGIELEDALACAGGQRSEPAGRVELFAGGAPPSGSPRGGSGGRELSAELVDDAVDRARMGRAVGELDGDSRERLVDELLDRLQDERDPLPEELRER